MSPAKQLHQDEGITITLYRAVVWNPWAEKGAAFGDMGDEGYRNMLCVETTNAAADTVSLAPGESFTQISRYTVESL